MKIFFLIFLLGAIQGCTLKVISMAKDEKTIERYDIEGGWINDSAQEFLVCISDRSNSSKNNRFLLRIPKNRLEKSPSVAFQYRYVYDINERNKPRSSIEVYDLFISVEYGCDVDKESLSSLRIIKSPTDLASHDVLSFSGPKIEEMTSKNQLFVVFDEYPVYDSALDPLSYLCDTDSLQPCMLIAFGENNNRDPGVIKLGGGQVGYSIFSVSKINQIGRGNPLWYTLIPITLPLDVLGGAFLLWMAPVLPK